MLPFPVTITGKAEGKVIATGHTFTSKRIRVRLFDLVETIVRFLPERKRKRKKEKRWGEEREGEREGSKKEKNTSILVLPGESSTYSKDVNENCACRRATLSDALLFQNEVFYIWLLPVHGNNTRHVILRSRAFFSRVSSFKCLHFLHPRIVAYLSIPRRCSRISAILRYDSSRVCSTTARSLFRKARRGSHFDVETGISG